MYPLRHVLLLSLSFPLFFYLSLSPSETPNNPTPRPFATFHYVDLVYIFLVCASDFSIVFRESEILVSAFFAVSEHLILSFRRVNALAD